MPELSPSSATPKSSTFHVAGLGEEQVVRLEVAVDDAAARARLEHLADLRDELAELAAGARAAAQQLAERLAAQPLHREERQRIGGVEASSTLHDVRRVDRAGDPDLAQEPLDVARIAEQLAAQQLDRGRRLPLSTWLAS